MPRTAVRLLQRHRQKDGSTLYFTAELLGGSPGNSRSTFIDPEHVPEFDGDWGWFELERVFATPWNYWRAIRAVEPPAGWTPPPPRPKPTPAQLLGHRS